MSQRQRRVSDTRGVIASTAVAVGCGALAYCVIGDQSIDASVRGVTRFLGPVSVSIEALMTGLVAAAVSGFAGALLLARWIRAGWVRRGWAAIALGTCAAASISAWSWRVLTASYEVVGSIHLWLAVGAAVVAWAVVGVGTVSYLRSFRRISGQRRRGCGYCEQRGNVLHGDVHMVSADEARQTSLLQCPRCGWLYTVAMARPGLVEPISEAEARDLFPSTW